MPASAHRRPPLSRPLIWVVAWRFLSGRRSRLLGGTARAALAATALGVTAMIIAMALMTGYREGLQRQLIGGNSALLAQPLLPSMPPVADTVVKRLEALPAVERVGRVVYGRGVLSAGGREAGVEVTLRGIDPEGKQLGTGARQLAVDAEGLAGAVLGRELAARLGVAPGDRLRLLALGFEAGRPRFRYRSLRVTDLFDTGFAEFDAEWVLLERELVAGLMGTAAFKLYEFTLDDPRRAAEVAPRVREVMGPDYLVIDWRQLNRELFTALEVQQALLFLLLGLIVVVSTFNVASTLMVLVRERMRDVGALGALGLAPRRLGRVFLLAGAVLGTAGTAAGVLVGVGAAWVLDTFELIRFNPEVAAIYFIRSVPFEVRPLDVAAVVTFTFGVNLAACLLPSRRAASVDPAEALRDE